MQQKNADLPAFPIMPFKNDFGQMIFLTGLTKHEYVALQILKSLISEFIDPEEEDFLIKESFRVAAKFLDYVQDEGQKESDIIMPV